MVSGTSLVIRESFVFLVGAAGIPKNDPDDPEQPMRSAKVIRLGGFEAFAGL